MADPLAEVRAYVSKYRFSGETAYDINQINDWSSSRRRASYGRGLVISDNITPELSSALKQSCQRLKIPETVPFHGIVFPSSDMQARCHFDGNRCVIEISSTLAAGLSTEELQFVLGHEIGHFLLGHLHIPMPQSGTVEYFKESRAREISADRIGLLATQGVSSCMRAIVKSSSGLPESLLRFDAANYLKEAFSDLQSHTIAAEDIDTHPSFAVRARCLIHFSNSFSGDGRHTTDEELEKSDKRSLADFNKYSEVLVDQRSNSLIDEYQFWSELDTIVHAGIITAEDTEYLKSRFEDDLVEGARKQLAASSKSEAIAFVCEKKSEAGLKLRSRLPLRFRELDGESKGERFRI